MHLFDRLTTQFQAGAERARHKAFLEASMAAAALAASDGRVSLARRHALDQVLESIEALRAFDVHEAVDLFTGHAQALREAPEDARAKALRAVSALAGDRAAAGLVVRVAAAIARADGPVGEAACREVERIAAALGVPAPDLAGPAFLDLAAAESRPRVIVLGNEKGGTGKSTTAVHLIVGLLSLGHRVGSLDLDARQGTLSRYFENRARFAREAARPLVMPVHRSVEESDARDRDEAETVERERLVAAFADMADCQFVVADTPGSNTNLGRLGHAHADVLVTPLNDSFLDIDVLALIDRDRREVLEPSAYSRMVWAQSERRVAGGRAPIDWIVMRNRLAHIDARSTREMAALLDRLSGRMNFRLQPGFSERVVYRELFYRGLTLLDIPEVLAEEPVPASHRHAHREVRDLLAGLGVPDLDTAPAAAAPAS